MRILPLLPILFKRVELKRIAIVAYTWDVFLKDALKSDWLIYFPIYQSKVKSAVRAMPLSIFIKSNPYFGLLG